MLKETNVHFIKDTWNQTEHLYTCIENPPRGIYEACMGIIQKLENSSSDNKNKGKKNDKTECFTIKFREDKDFHGIPRLLISMDTNDVSIQEIVKDIFIQTGVKEGDIPELQLTNSVGSLARQVRLIKNVKESLKSISNINESTRSVFIDDGLPEHEGMTVKELLEQSLLLEYFFLMTLPVKDMAKKNNIHHHCAIALEYVYTPRIDEMKTIMRELQRRKSFLKISNEDWCYANIISDISSIKQITNQRQSNEIFEAMLEASTSKILVSTIHDQRYESPC